VIGSELNGRYHIIGSLGRGTMGEVFLAEHLLLGRREAIKVLRPSAADATEYAVRFRREARALNQVTHPHIVAIYDFGMMEDGRLFLAMEYAEGSALSTVIKKEGALPLERALGIVAQVAEAIDHAHGRGVIHRDLKPANLVVQARPGGRELVKILDFGLAKIVTPDYQESLAATSDGHTFGTPNYIAPERLVDSGGDGRSDIYSLGCIAFELLTGEVPFVGELMDVCHRHVTERARAPSERRPDLAIPAEVDEVVLRCLAKPPGERFQRAGAIADLLRGILAGRPARRRPQSVPAMMDTERQPALSIAEAAAELGAAGDLERPVDRASELVEVANEFVAELFENECGDADLLVALAEVSEAQSLLRRWEAELEELDRRRDTIDQYAREREASLRFALGELQFSLRHGSETPMEHGRVERAIAELSHRLEQLRWDADRELASLEQHRHLVSTSLERIEDDLLGRCRRLAGIAHELSGRFRHLAAVARLGLRLEALVP
jgi:tRNA A-37 threonylcarbamoyl transferase component Bud32